MPGKKKNPNKTYSPDWGGPGRGGPPKKNKKLRIIKIQCTQEELAQILAGIPDTRERTEILLEKIKNDSLLYPRP